MGRALWTCLRVLVTPFYKLDKIIPESGLIMDVGCGNGGVTNYLSTGSKKRKLIGVDYSESRISEAQKSVHGRKNIKFVLGDVTSKKFPRADCYFFVDVLHHIPFTNQIVLLKRLVSLMNKKTILVIKEVDTANTLPFWFGHISEKILYPTEKIYARSKNDWLKIFSKMGLSYQIETGTLYFPDSTLIYILTKNNLGKCYY